MSYNKQTWNNGSEGGTPLNAARLNHLETGVSEADITRSGSEANEYLNSNYVPFGGTTPGIVPVVKPAGDTRAAVWEYTHNAETGYIYHLLSGSNMGHNAAILGLGIDNDGIGIMLPNKRLGRGIVGDQRATITSADAYWMHATQRSSLAPLVRLEMQANNAAPLMQLLAFGTPGATQQLLYVGDANGEAGGIMASNGAIRWRRQVQIFDRSDADPSFVSVRNNSGTTAGMESYTRLGKSGIEWWNNTGSANSWWPFRIQGGIGSMLRIQGAGQSTAVGTATYTDVITIRNAQIGFFGATASAQKARVGALTDSSGGTSGGATVPAVTDTATAANAIATLTAKVNALEAVLSAAAGGFGLTA
ncbi:hypothetical protein SEA_SIXAMA_85 [Gordonia phage Sixama]|uniref:Uncharacterized protein n=1 Tax=Gordonia phage Sixama TaxID=2653271 RepID=A0A5Q2F5A7_9CAUD|nr:hypothetical protein PP302_gp085 [Gordonia phage Sixama]QGF20264.1 hypothetical protein SEA_SIXAMA_85 [Gordonia phage Sixama]